MNCHTQIWAHAPMLEPVRASYRTGQSVAWNRVHRLPDFVFFDHSIHVKKGVGCTTCHGHVDRMPLTRQTESLYMEWCLDCHRHPERDVRPREQVFNLAWKPEGDDPAGGARRVRELGILTRTDCVDCHR